MRAMILAAGLGKRMLPLTADCPKPLLKVGEKSLIEHQIGRLAAAGVKHVVVNHFHLGRQLEEALGDGSRFGVSIDYSREAILLNTAGGIIKSLPKLKDDCFIVVNADIWTEFDFARLQEIDGHSCLAHLVLVENRDHNPQGDFFMSRRGRVHEDSSSADRRLTFSGISVMHRRLFAGYPIQPRSVVPLLRNAMEEDKVSGELFDGVWVDVGTPERLKQVNNMVRATDQEASAVNGN